MVDPVDIVIGKKLRLRRTLMGFTQEEVAERLGLSFQQVQKYETASNRTSAAVLFKMATVLDKPVDWFFTADDFKDEDQNGSHEAGPLGVVSDASAAEGEEVNYLRRETLEFTRCMGKIESKRIRDNLVTLIEAMAAELDFNP